MQHVRNGNRNGSDATAALRLSLAVSCVAALGLARATAAAQTDYYNTDRNRPVRIEDAYPTELRSFDVHLAPVRLERSTGGVYTWALEPEIAYGLLPRTQLEIGTPLAYTDLGSGRRRVGLTGIDLSMLYNLNVETSSLPALGVRGTVVVPAGSLAPDHVFSSIEGIATRTFRWARFHVNAEYTGGPTPSTEALNAAPGISGAARSADPLGTGASEISRWLAGVAVDHTFPLRAMLVTGEAYARQPIRDGTDVQWNAGVGARYQLDPYFAIDAGLGKRLTGDDQSWYVTFGVARVFGLRGLMPVR